MKVSDTGFYTWGGLNIGPHSELINVLKALNQIRVACYGAFRMYCYVIPICCMTFSCFRSNISKSLPVVVKLSRPRVLTIPVGRPIKRTLAFRRNTCYSWIKNVSAELCCVRSITRIRSCYCCSIELNWSKVGTFTCVCRGSISESCCANYSVPHHKTHCVGGPIKAYCCSNREIIDRDTSLSSLRKLSCWGISAGFVHLTIIIFITVFVQLARDFTGCFMGIPCVSSTSKTYITVKVRSTGFSLSSSSANAIITVPPHALMMISALSPCRQVHLEISFNHTESRGLLLEGLRSRNCSHSLSSLINKCICTPVPIGNFTLSPVCAGISRDSWCRVLSIVHVANLIFRSGGVQCREGEACNFGACDNCPQWSSEHYWND